MVSSSAKRNESIAAGIPVLREAPQIRPAEPAEMGEFARVVSTSLAMPADRFDSLQPGWSLRTSGGDTELRKTTADPDFVAPVSTIAMLLYGQLSPTEAWRMGRLEAPTGESLARYDTLLRSGYRPFCADHF